ncbi:MAG: hypothetical protein IKZ46_17550 [Victivallales bacterium]|nr:hypothetical protein [Victivallales bacterium]
MDKKLREYFDGKVDNHLLPFYWQHGDHYDKIPEQIERIAASGCRAFCVESRPHRDFCGETWWRDMDLILSEAKKRDMKVWILDDNHFPTGNANGLLKEKYPELRKWHLTERHVDVVGPMADSALLVQPDNDERHLLGVFAYQRTELDETISEEAIDLSDKIVDGQLIWDVPRGVWRVFFLYKSRAGVNPGQKFYIDMMNAESVAVLLEAVYEPHYKHYKKYFGNTLAGFFSDEPSLGNLWFGTTEIDRGMYNHRLGMPGLGLPWHDDMLCGMDAALGGKGLASLPALWYDMGKPTGAIRLAYMDLVTKRYRDCFVRQLGDWCRARGVEYIGHIIEDMNAHARLGCSAGHYFRSQDGQDMSGMDVVLHQVMPGMGHFKHTASCSGGYVNPEFFHYVLPKLCSSAAHLNPAFKGRAMCEVFGAFGWAEGSPFMKWLMDFLMVRGINQFVPHAFSPAYPDPDCPPHFGAEGHDPQFEGFTKIMGYTNRMCHLLDDAHYEAKAALLYHAEAEWMSRDLDGAMLTQKPARILMDNHVDFDIVPADDLVNNATVEKGRLVVNGNHYDCLIVPSSPELPAALLDAMAALVDSGLKIWFIDQAPEDCFILSEVIPLQCLAKAIKEAGLADIEAKEDIETLCHSHWKRGKADIFYFVNESTTDVVDTKVVVPCSGDYLVLDVLEEKVFRGKTATGIVPLNLAPYESCVVVFGAMTNAEWKAFLPEHEWNTACEVKPKFKISLADADDLSAFKPYVTTDKLFNVTGKDHEIGFSGVVRYEGSLKLKAEQTTAVLDLGVVGQTAHVWLNGVDLGLRVCPPYRYDLKGIAKVGQNDLRIEVANTLANKVRDHFSYFMQLTPSGLLGPVRLLR